MQTRGLLILVAGACGALMLAVMSPAATDNKFGAELTGAGEVPVRATRASGFARVDINDDESVISFKLNVKHITNVRQAHIHIGQPTVNGPVVAFLYGLVPAGGGPVSGRLSSGDIGASDLVGPLAGQPLSVLIGHIRSGNAYVNVHTDDGIPPTNTGPGDFPGGEIRGQISEDHSHGSDD